MLKNTFPVASSAAPQSFQEIPVALLIAVAEEQIAVAFGEMAEAGTTELAG